MRTSNHLIALLSFLTFLASTPILSGSIWLSSRSCSTSCMKFLQWPLIVISGAMILVSLACFLGASYHATFLMCLYLWLMLFIIVALMGFIIFAYVVTNRGQGRHMLNQVYLEYYLQDYSGWLKEWVTSHSRWQKISSCIKDSCVCAGMETIHNGIPQAADMFYLRKLNPIESGCCKPPLECGYVYQNETVWIPGAVLTGTNIDCTRWSYDPELLCYNCDSCKAGLLASLKKSWRKVSLINIVMLTFLVIVYVVACIAIRHNKRIEKDLNKESTI